MRDIANDVSAWVSAGHPVVLARVMSMEGFGGRRTGEAWAYTPGFPAVGAVAMGAGNAAVAETAHRMLADDSLGALTILVPVGEEEAVAAGLACGGVASVLVQRASLVPSQVWDAIAARIPVVVATALGSGAVMAVMSDGSGGTAGSRPQGVGRPGEHRSGAEERSPNVTAGTLGSAELDAAVVASAQAMLTKGRVQSETVADAAFVEIVGPQPHLVVLGEAELAQSMVAQGRLLGWVVSVMAEARTVEAVAAVDNMGPLDAAVVLSHDIGQSCEVLAAALNGGCGYAGALGSRHTQGARADHLRSLGLADDVVARVHGPVGLDLGSRTPPETALAIFAEIIAHRSGRAATSLRGGAGPING